MSSNSHQESETCIEVEEDEIDLNEQDNESIGSSASSFSEDLSNEILQLQQQVGFNPSYENFEKYIAALRSAMKIHELRLTRESMASRYPLDKAIWIQWIDDEIQIGSDRDYIMKLFDKSVQDFLSVDIWLRYTNFVSRELGQSDVAMSIFERAITACGAHFTEGYALWDAYRTYDKDPERHKKLYIRQLGTPSLQMDDVMEQYLKWHQATFGCAAAEVLSFSKAKTVYNRLLPFEGNLLNAYETNLWNHWSAYINSELSQNNPHILRVSTLFERALAIFFSSDFVWQKYIRFLRINRFRSDNKSQKVALLAVCRRAVRNCPWSNMLWCEFIISASADDPNTENAMAVFEEAMNQSFPSSDAYIKIILEMCYAKARDTDSSSDPSPLRTLFQKASSFDQYSENSVPFSDAMFNLYRFWADIELHIFDSKVDAREHWNTILKRTGKQPQFWLQYFQFEKEIGDIEKCRSAFRRGVHLFQHDDGLQIISSAWVTFETEHGSLESRDEAICKTSLLLEMQHLKRGSEPTPASQISAKRKSETSHPKESTSKKAKVSISPNDLEDTISRFKPEAISTAFALNVDHKVSEKELEQLFSPFGTVVQVRMPRDIRGHKRGFAYIDFSEKQSVEAAIENLNRTELHGRFLKVEEFKGDVSRNASRRSIRMPNNYESTLENNIVFLKGIDKELSQAKVETLLRERFKKFGNIVNVRIPPAGRSSKLKGIAYIEFESESQSNAALAENGFDLNNGIISVAISNPPTKHKQERTTESALFKSQSSGVCSPFKPRGFAVPQIPISKSRKPTLTMHHSGKVEQLETELIGKSNLDFRNLFLNKQG